MFQIGTNIAKYVQEDFGEGLPHPAQEGSEKVSR
jgi:hypothetical protein